MKRLIIVIIAGMLLSIQYGCGQRGITRGSGAEETLSVYNPSSQVLQGIKLERKAYKAEYLLSNGIEILNINKAIATSKGEIPAVIPKISGLRNKTVEERLNKAIESDIEKEIKRYSEEKNGEGAILYPVVELNSNNLISIGLRGFESAPLYGFLYRLTDGKALSLKEVFTKGTDYISLLNNKISEGILEGIGEEENYLSEPFKTIKADQNYALTDSNLYIVFDAGDNGFLERSSVTIPLWEIDDYVDVIDRYSGTQSTTQEKSNLMERENNIFTIQRGDIIKRNQGSIWCYYPVILGLGDSNFEELINKTINEAINEAAKDKNVSSLVKKKDQGKDCSAIIYMNLYFNHYGVLCIKRDVNTFDYSKNFQQLSKVYTFDLIKKKILDPKELVKNYIGGDKDLQQKFTELVKGSVQSWSGSSGQALRNKIISMIDYEMIMDKGQMGFLKYGEQDGSVITIHFNENTIKDISTPFDCEVRIKEFASGGQEEFFSLVSY